MNKVITPIRKGLHFFASAFMYSVILLMVLIFITVIVYVLEQKQNSSKDRYIAPLFSAYVIITNSMDPAIAVNDVVIDRKILASSLKIGDVITFVSNDPIAFGKTITHRITGKDQDKDGFHRFRTKGDNNNVEDNWIVSETHILGKVMFKIPKLGYIQQFLATSYGWIAAIVLPCLIIIIYDIVKLIATLVRSSKRQKSSDKNIPGAESINKSLYSESKEKKYSDDQKNSNNELETFGVKKIEEIEGDYDDKYDN